MTREDLAALAAEANLAPSVHNTQPTRWRLAPDGAVEVLEDTTRRLPVGDPLGRDADVSHGCAIEGFALACARRGQSITVEPLSGEGALRPVARLILGDDPGPDPLQAAVPVRRTYRGAFAKDSAAARLDAIPAADDLTLVGHPTGIGHLAALNDIASLKTFRDAAYRAELVSWMRLSRRHPGWALDGLNAEAMEMSGVEAAGAGFVLRPGVFEALDGLGLARLFVAEAPVVRSAAAIALFHRPDGEPPLATGRRFHRLWLEFTAAGLDAAPMAVLADDVPTRTEIAAAFAIPPGRRLITAFRLGIAPPRKLGPKPRLPSAALLA